MGSFTSGLGAQLGLAPETTYGTEVTVSKFFEFATEQMQLSRAFLESSELRAGRMFQSATRRTATTRSAAGTVAMEVPTQGFGQLLNLLHGNVVTPVQQAATTAYLQTHNIGTTDPFKKSITLQIGKPTDEGVVVPFTYPGTVVTSLAFSCQTGGFLDVTATLDSNNELVTTPVLATASYPTALESFNFVQCKVKVNSVEQKQARGVTLTINTPKDTGRYYMGQEKKGVPLTNAYNGATLGLTVDYADSTLYNLFAKAETVPVEVSFIGPIIASTYHEELKFVFAEVGLDGDTPNVAGPGVLQQNIPLVVLDSGSGTPVVATYMSTDVAL
jgi:Phage tail tube protein